LYAYAQAAEIVNPIPDPITPNGVKVKLVPLAAGLTAPNWGVAAPGDSKHTYVTDQNGILWKINTRSGERSVFLDVKARLIPLGAFGPGSFDERGLLGIAFHPRYASNGLLYTFTSEPTSSTPDFPAPDNAAANVHNRVIEWRVSSPGGNNSVVNPASARVVMTWAKPQFNHNGGALEFGEDGM
jgi:glucose/arabinose dehydrogenase